MAGRTSKKTMTFESGLERLESIADAMESGERPLDELLKLYEEGMKLAEDLAGKLEQAKGRMYEVHAAADGMPVAAPADLVQQTSMMDESMGE